MTRHQFITKTKPFLNCPVVVYGICSRSTSVYEVLPMQAGVLSATRNLLSDHAAMSR